MAWDYGRRGQTGIQQCRTASELDNSTCYLHYEVSSAQSTPSTIYSYQALSYLSKRVGSLSSCWTRSTKALASNTCTGEERAKHQKYAMEDKEDGVEEIVMRSDFVYEMLKAVAVEPSQLAGQQRRSCGALASLPFACPSCSPTAPVCRLR